MAEDNIDIEVTGFQTLRAQIKEATIEMQKLAAAGKEGTDEYVRAAAKVGTLKDELGDAADTAAALGTAAGRFGAITKSLSVVAGGFTAIQGAIGLAGGDAKEFEKTMQRVQSAMALSTGLAQLAELGDAFKNVGKVAVSAFNSIKVALGSTGLGLLVVGLGAAVAVLAANWDTLKASLYGTTDALALTDEELKKVGKDIGTEIGKVEILTATVNDQTLSEKERLKALKKLQEEYPNYFTNLGNDINDTESLDIAKKNLIQTLVLEAKTRALQGKITEKADEAATKQLELEEEKKKLNKEVVEETLRLIKLEDEGRDQSGQKNLKASIAKKQSRINSIKDEKDALEKELSNFAESIVKVTGVAQKEIDKLGGASKPPPIKPPEKPKGKTKEQIAAELEQEKQNKLVVAATMAALDKETLAKQVEAADKAFAVKIAGLKKQGFTEVQIGELRDAELEKVRTDYYAKEKEARDKAADDAIKDKEKKYQETKDATDKYFNEEQAKAIKNGDDLNAIEVARLKKKISGQKKKE
jgi:hypothetical protein